MPKTIRLMNVSRERKLKVSTYDLTLQGFVEGEEVELIVLVGDTDPDSVFADQNRIGAIKGTVLWPDKQVVTQVLQGAKATQAVQDGMRFGILTNQKSGGSTFYFRPVSPPELDTSESWEIQMRLQGDDMVHSGTIWLPHHQRTVSPERATYGMHRGNTVTFYNDAATDPLSTEGYFADLDVAIDEARHFIFIADWSFHPYMKLYSSADQTIGEKLAAWARGHDFQDPALRRLVAIHTWDHTNIAMPDAQNDGAESIFRDKIPKPSNMLWRKSSRTGIGYSHHQKFVVMDAPGPGGRKTVRAFIGGIDLAQGRLDWPDHPIWPDHQHCQNLLRVTDHGVHEWYSAEFDDPPLTGNKANVDAAKTTPRQPWHDIHCQVLGPTAWDVIREFIGRWHRDPSIYGAGGNKVRGTTNALLAFFSNQVLFDKKLFVQPWEPHPGEWRGQILRSLIKDHWHWEGDKWNKPATVKTPAKPKGEFQWALPGETEHSIQDSYLQAIAQAEKYVYIETQYFIGSGADWIHRTRSSIKNDIPNALIKRIRAKISAQEPFHVYLIVPMFPEGNPADSAAQAQRDFQWNSIASVIRGIQKGQPDGFNWRDYFTVGFLANWKENAWGVLNTEDGFRDAPTRKKRVIANCRYMIYVHSKFMLIDDRYAIIGSANLNERSLAGDRDSEICVALWPRLSKEQECVESVRTFRKRLWQEHFGGEGDNFNDPQTVPCARKIQEIGDNNWTLLSAGKTDEFGLQKSGHFVCWPIDGSRDDLGFRSQEKYIFDGLAGPIRGDDWYWWPTHYTGIIIEGAAE